GEIQALASGAVAARKQAIAPNQPPKPTRPIEFPIHEEVEVSIVIPVFNQLRFTQACLASLQEHQGAERFEVIVVDDCSTDETSQCVRQIPGMVYLRKVDYCSAAALMIPKSLFESVGGFDSRYAPAYYEDTDLAFKVRQAGYKVLYQPLSEVIHYEGATGGTDITTGTKKYQDINRSTFAKTWAAELVTKPANGDAEFLRQAPTGRKNILVIDHYVPSPDRDSGSLRMFQVLKLLRQLGHRVTFIPDNLANVPV